ncbi:hypothetical protein PC129_g23933 [Phytophthora cactorum]|uniref:Uncharacterized protein n=1 Tax=Phytophthora cactorum TaxID=29920 RepID=A0A329RFG0_9STRA|nr:hypothetical protein Pcac1_g1176 [Phytophthora cactorum]KAG2790308.1 hypothetical protein PC111_g24092 [Phytophthora cactorum]KAG2808095.1 hypothetical protein PC112_g17110 [Phytophthora cactorum]KAG2852911.1 hypothetical protein PC113_g14617 [Phytophthora cactorum]KAG2871155.1 hypothetical protein PC114_g27055 [Phytophthora cactorum]
MASHLEFLDELSAFLETDPLLQEFTPPKLLEENFFQHNGPDLGWGTASSSPSINYDESGSFESNASVGD